MPVPFHYDNAGVEFHQLLRDARDLAGLETTNQSYTMVEGVLLTFRRRLTLSDGLRFADVLPAVARAIFVARWDVSAAVIPFGTREQMTREVQALRAEHNYAPDSCISVVATALRRNLDNTAFDRSLDELGTAAIAYWTPSDWDDRRGGFPR